MNSNTKCVIGAKGPLVNLWCNFRCFYRDVRREVINKRIDPKKFDNLGVKKPYSSFPGLTINRKQGIAKLTKVLVLLEQRRYVLPSPLP